MQAKENYAIDVTRTFIANDFKILLFFFLSLFLTFLYFFWFHYGPHEIYSSASFYSRWLYSRTLLIS